MANRNLELLVVAAKLLRTLLDELVFVGGCADSAANACSEGFRRESERAA